MRLCFRWFRRAFFVVLVYDSWTNVDDWRLDDKAPSHHYNWRLCVVLAFWPYDLHEKFYIKHIKGIDATETARLLFRAGVAFFRAKNAREYTYIRTCIFQNRIKWRARHTSANARCAFSAQTTHSPFCGRLSGSVRSCAALRAERLRQGIRRDTNERFADQQTDRLEYMRIACVCAVVCLTLQKGRGYFKLVSAVNDRNG